MRLRRPHVSRFCRKGGYRPLFGIRRLTPEQVARIRTPGANVSSLAREFTIAGSAAWKIRHRITYRDLPTVLPAGRGDG